MIIVKVDPITGIPETGYPKFFDPELDNNSSTTDVLQSRIFSSDPFYSNGNFDGFVSSGRAQKNGETFNRALISKTNADGTPDTDFGTNGYYFGPASSEARTVIQIAGSSGIQFVYIGDINVSATDKDVLVEAIDEDGQLVWSQQFSEVNLSSVYSDDTQNDASVCSNLTSPGFENEIERGWDVIQDGDALYLSCMFDVLDLSGTAKDNQCPEYIPYDFYMNVDIALLKIELTDGDPVKASNPAQFEASDFYPDIEIKDGSLYLLGARTTYENDEVKTKTVVMTLNTDLEVENEKQFNTLGEINCSFDLNFNCEDEIIVTGNNEINEEDYYFYKLSNGCQLVSTFDITNNMTISGNTTWSSSQKVGATVIVADGGSLTINSAAVIEFGASWDLVDYNVLAENDAETKTPRIIVENGGELILDNCTLRGLSACANNAMWDGVELQNGGSVSLSNGAVIMDAKIGILADIGSYNANGHYNPTESNGGGIIQSNNTTITNCRRGIHFAYCQSNPSSISATTFSCTGYLKDPSYKTFYTPVASNEGFVHQLGTSSFVSTHVASGMIFSDCDWVNTADLPPDLRGTGIASYNAAYRVTDGSSMTDLNYGISAQTIDPLKFIYVSGNNQFIGNKTGIFLKGGNLHKIINDNHFESKVSYDSEILPVQAGVGIYNSGSTKILLEENSFSAGMGASKDYTYGIISENTGSAASLHKKNVFDNIQVGDQTQVNNGGLNFWCNEHQDNVKAWFINPQTAGAFPDQGWCGVSASLTPENEFLDPACETALNHIQSSIDFDYWRKQLESSYPDCNSTIVNLEICSQPNIKSGCEESIFLTSGNVQDYFTEVSNMPEGTERELLVNELLRYYVAASEIDTILLLLDVESGENYKMALALLLLNQGEISEAIDVVESLSGNSSETQSFSEFFYILVYAAQNELSLSELPQAKIEDLEEIAENRNIGGYSAQAVLSEFYKREFLSIIETDSSLEYRIWNDKKRNSSLKKNLFRIHPVPVNDKLNVSYNLVDEPLFTFSIHSIEGKAWSSVKSPQGRGTITMVTEMLPPGIYILQLSNGSKMIEVQKFIKK